jgi:NADP-dependent 3-hydroxy acid dehydrogenase YdfG
MDRPLAVITGASSGIGLGVAQAFAAAGHPLLLIARHMKARPDLDGKPVVYAQADVADFDAVQRAVRDAERAHGPTDCLVNSAGMLDARPFDQVDPASYAREIDTNLRGVLNGIKAVLAGMVERRRGTIINISSVSDRKTAPMAIAYTATKYAVRALTESLREAQAKTGIRIINIAPGYVETRIHEQMGITFDQYRQALGNPDFMTAAELAAIIMFCYQQPAHICIRDLVVTPTRATF